MANIPIIPSFNANEIFDSFENVREMIKYYSFNSPLELVPYLKKNILLPEISCLAQMGEKLDTIKTQIICDNCVKIDRLTSLLKNPFELPFTIEYGYRKGETFILDSYNCKSLDVEIIENSILKERIKMMIRSPRYINRYLISTCLYGEKNIENLESFMICNDKIYIMKKYLSYPEFWSDESVTKFVKDILSLFLRLSNMNFVSSGSSIVFDESSNDYVLQNLDFCSLTVNNLTFLPNIEQYNYLPDITVEEEGGYIKLDKMTKRWIPLKRRNGYSKYADVFNVLETFLPFLASGSQFMNYAPRHISGMLTAELCGDKIRKDIVTYLLERL
ncbi:MAG: hypothetical protein AAB966_04995 [Patescibacteria group bacterium]